MPVGIKKFEAKANDQNHVDINWISTFEENVSHFEVERSKDGKTYESIIRKDAGGNSKTLNDYNATDTKPFTGISYYRLKISDLDGSFQLSYVIPVTIGLETLNEKVYPNPFQTHVKIEINLPKEEKYRVFVKDLWGRTLYTTQGEGTSNSSTEILLPLESLSEASYILEIITQNRKIVKKIVKNN